MTNETIQFIYNNLNEKAKVRLYDYFSIDCAYDLAKFLKTEFKEERKIK